MITTMDSASLSAIQNMLMQGQYQEASRALTELLKQQPANAEAIYMAAVCQRYLKQYGEAQNNLDMIKLTAGDKGRVYQEQAYLYQAQNQLSQALAAFQTACQLNPALLSSWKAQLMLSQQLGHSAQAQFAQSQMQQLKHLPKPVLTVIDLIAQHKLVKAEALCRKFLLKNPTHIEGMRLLAQIGVKLGEVEDAEFLLETAAAAAPKSTVVQIDYVQTLRRRHKYQQALDQAKKLHQNQPDNPQLMSVYAIELMHAGDYAAAVNLFDRVLGKLPKDPITLTSRGHALKTWGKNSAAIESYRTAIEFKSTHGEAWYSLANLKTYRFAEADIATMQNLDRQIDLGPMHKVHLNFALGKALEDSGDYEQAFRHYQMGNHIKRQQSGYDADKMEEELLAQRTFFTPECVAAGSGRGCLASDPIFIVGLPRAGSTLLEQILSSHSQVDGTLELPNILAMAQKLRRTASGYPDRIAELSEEELVELGQQYIAETRMHRQSAPFFIDKMPNNFRHIGLIKLILPKAKIIDARRDAMACCFSGFKQLFAEGQEFSYSLEDIGRYHRDYVELMGHWKHVFPQQILQVQYEDVVADLEHQIVRLLDFCGLPFEQACLDFHLTKRAVRTASSEQVRQPIYKTGVDQWRKFEAQLEPLKAALTRGQK